MRSRDEILFRLGQEAGNLWLYLRRPRLTAPAAKAPLSALPSPESVAAALRGSEHAARFIGLAESVLAHRFPLLGLTIETGPEIDWLRDYSTGVAYPARYFRFVPYLDPGKVGDHKVVWELNRHQHWVLLAQAFLLTGNRAFLTEVESQFDSWESQNPYLRGINWASALEVAFRALSWAWVFHLAGALAGQPFCRRLLAGLFQHGLYLERNLSVYFSPNTHLLGEAVALHALGALFPALPRSRAWEQTGARIVKEQMAAQVREDGSHFEQSSYYHVYALDMFLFHAVLRRPSPEYAGKIRRMASYVAALLGPARRLPFLGDDDGGRFFHPYGARDRFARATLATAAALLGENASGCATEDACEQAAWWIGPEALGAHNSAACDSRFFPDAGVAVMTSGDVQIVIDAGPFGAGSGGHSHSDTLALTVRARGEDILVDPGTYTYIGEPWRDRFRSSAMHNTLRIDGLDQATPAGPFRWSGRPQARVLEWTSGTGRDVLAASCSYSGFTHERRVTLDKPRRLVIEDAVHGPPGEHLVEQYWHPGAPVQKEGGGIRIGRNALLGISDAELLEGGEFGWCSAAFGVKQPAPVVKVTRKTTLPARFTTVLDL